MKSQIKAIIMTNLVFDISSLLKVKYNHAARLPIQDFLAVSMPQNLFAYAFSNCISYQEEQT